MELYVCSFGAQLIITQLSTTSSLLGQRQNSSNQWKFMWGCVRNPRFAGCMFCFKKSLPSILKKPKMQMQMLFLYSLFHLHSLCWSRKYCCIKDEVMNYVLLGLASLSNIHKYVDYVGNLHGIFEPKVQQHRPNLPWGIQMHSKSNAQ